jgi:flavorubredoxin
MDASYRPASDVHVLPTSLAIPGVGNIIINAFVILAEEPVLVDTGIAADRTEFLDALRSVIDPGELRWLWLTHDDADHTGNLDAVMALAPAIRLVTHGLGVLRLATWCPVPLDRVHAVRPGDHIDAGDRQLHALRPPVFDNPMTAGLLDDKTGALFSVDAFGAILPTTPQDAADVPEADLAAGMTAWTTFDTPWTHLVERDRFGRAVTEFARLDPAMIFSSHLPAAAGTSIDQFAKVLEAVPDADPFVAPDQHAFEAILAGMAPVQ